MSGDTEEGIFSKLPRTLAKLAKTGSVQNAKQSLKRKSYLQSFFPYYQNQIYIRY